MNQITTVNPATGENIRTYSAMDKDQVVDLVRKAKRAFPEWKKDYEKRRSYVYNLVEYLKKNKTELAKVATAEMGKALKESIGEVEKCAWALEFYADHGDSFLADEVLNTDARKSFLTFEPLGVIGSIMPWNFPYWQALRFAAPCLMAGNVIVMKPARITIQSGIEIEKAFTESGIPDGIFQTVIGSVESANYLIDSDVNAVTFTGSTIAGAKVGERAASNLKKCVLELGGSDPFIVLDDAIIEKAAEGAVKGRFINCGQSCVASKRFFVGKNVADEFIELFIKKASQLKVGDPMSIETDIGPISSKDGLDTISGIVEDAKKKGAEILLGGSEMEGKGFFYKPTILTNVKPDMRIAKEETFGPVAPITIVENESEAVRLANESEFGLGASIWTKDLEKADKMSRRIESGIVSVNNVVISDPRIPFGGIKHSGFGRELSRYGMLEFVNLKSVRFYDNLTHHHYVE
ncbi:MAG: NAD-dependent succinate-semialdehyde dehydrogenase [Nitrosopumilus sp.]|nr:NAD-dependent succinate-semialdehyde dehydrogenase [Nitrosopumilus sp.]